MNFLCFFKFEPKFDRENNLGCQVGELSPVDFESLLEEDDFEACGVFDAFDFWVTALFDFDVLA